MHSRRLVCTLAWAHAYTHLLYILFMFLKMDILLSSALDIEPLRYLFSYQSIKSSKLENFLNGVAPAAAIPIMSTLSNGIENSSNLNPLL